MAQLARNNRLMIVLFASASVCFLFPFTKNEEGADSPYSTGIEYSKTALDGFFSDAGNNTSVNWMPLVALGAALSGCLLNLSFHSAEMLNSLLAGIAYLNLFSFRTEKMDGFSSAEPVFPASQHFEAGYWIALLLLLIIVIQQVYRFIRWQSASHAEMRNGIPPLW